MRLKIQDSGFRIQDSRLTRRELLRTAGCAGVCLPFMVYAAPVVIASAARREEEKSEHKGIFVVKEVAYYKKLKNKQVECETCPKKCKVGDQERGYCGNKENRNGKYVTLVYGNPCAMHVDPIEKKPFFHFLPGTSAFSISTAGCNFNCKFCQNWDISQSRPEQTPNTKLLPADVAYYAKRSNSESIAYTYGEPVVFYEYMYDCAVEGHKSGVRSVMISNGYIEEKPMRKLCKVLDAVKIDFKAYTDKFYKDTCDGTLKPVLDVLVLLKEIGVWFEMVYLVVPTLNDNMSDIKKMTAWIMKNLGPDVPLHFTRFHPTYLLKNLPVTPVKTLEAARRTALDGGMHYVYVGNVVGHEGENTYCPKCSKVVIGRIGYTLSENSIDKNGKCKFCRTPIAGVWK
ncbi:MAG: AmmeMemoRadiSam system radical SAM enzyme [bacterium]